MSKHDHDGHRDRVRKKFLNGGFEGFYEHEVLEMLLFYSVPRRDTNEMAHRLIDRFHGLNNVWDAKMQLLQEVDGVTENSALLISIVSQICKMYVNRVYDENELKLDSDESVYEFAMEQYAGVESQSLKVLFLDRRRNYVGCVDVCETAGANVVTIMNALRRVIERSQRYQTDYMVLMHNYPGDSVDYDGDDDSIVQSASRVLRHVGIVLVDYVVVCNDTCKSMYNQRKSSDSSTRKKVGGSTWIETV
jgi:DNA repair protein RadC